MRRRSARGRAGLGRASLPFFSFFFSSSFSFSLSFALAAALLIVLDGCGTRAIELGPSEAPGSGAPNPAGPGDAAPPPPAAPGPSRPPAPPAAAPPADGQGGEKPPPPPPAPADAARPGTCTDHRGGGQICQVCTNPSGEPTRECRACKLDLDADERRVLVCDGGAAGGGARVEHVLACKEDGVCLLCAWDDAPERSCRVCGVDGGALRSYEECDRLRPELARE